MSFGDQARVDALIATRILTRKPAAYITKEAWLQGVPFYVDERAIVPRSFIAELLVDGSTVHVIRERESAAEQMRHERLVP